MSDSKTIKCLRKRPDEDRYVVVQWIPGNDELDPEAYVFADRASAEHYCLCLDTNSGGKYKHTIEKRATWDVVEAEYILEW